MATIAATVIVRHVDKQVNRTTLRQSCDVVTVVLLVGQSLSAVVYIYLFSPVLAAGCTWSSIILAGVSTLWMVLSASVLTMHIVLRCCTALLNKQAESGRT